MLVDGTDVSANFVSRLVELRMTDASGRESDCVTILLDNKDRELVAPRRGALMYAAIGWNGSHDVDGEYIVESSVIEGGGEQPFTLSVEGKSADLRETIKQHRTEDHQKTTVGALVNKLAQRNSLTPAVGQDLASVELDYLGQSEESDMHLLSRLARRLGAVAAVKDRRLLFTRKGSGQGATGTSLGSATVVLTDIIYLRCAVKDRPRFGKVQTTYMDRGTGLEKLYTKEFGDGGPDFFIRHPFSTKDEAERAAGARARELETEGNTLTLTLHGRGDIAAEMKLNVVGICPNADGQWSVERVEQVLDQSGWRTEVECTRDKADKDAGGDESIE
ncbi:contractile injection system protein, VgrG/Pvc8 family [Chelatococcus asaccharovorans]|uniref:contractile injection system protein, VgrG/Pvc8 family n=1 Tax=Chelatococcus asaccharovorans TaxID=28210 RepID=UPI0014752B26|nr:contractile injection system protein, VgrG/Pvc8 family [Chelatococcus asaccharovorans]MBS7703335.1 hypothetical protein [Chelatococcus asaccharovorans]